MWNVATRGLIQVPDHSSVQRGAVRCVLWITRRQDSFDLLCFGTGLGYLVIWEMNVSDWNCVELCSADYIPLGGPKRVFGSVYAEGG